MACKYPYSTRFLHNASRSGSIPDTVLFLSFFYKSNELPKRLTGVWISYTVAGIIGSFHAFGFLHIKDSHGGGSWRYLFAYEGLITGVIGIIAAFWMPTSPVQTKGGFRGKNGWDIDVDEFQVRVFTPETETPNGGWPCFVYVSESPSLPCITTREGVNGC